MNENAFTRDTEDIREAAAQVITTLYDERMSQERRLEWVEALAEDMLKMAGETMEKVAVEARSAGE